MDSAVLQNRGWILHCKIEGGFCAITSFGCLELVREEGLYFLQKQKVAKTFKLLGLQNLGGIVESTRRILRNCGIEGKHRICGGFCEILRNCRIASKLESVK